MTTVKSFVFSDGSTANAGVGHQIDLGSGLAAGQVDVLGVISDAAVTTPSGWAISVNNTDVAVAAMYVFRRTTGASGLVTIKTAADRPVAVIHVRLAGVASVDDARKAVVSGVAAATSPTVTSATLLASGEAAVAFALLHNWATAPTGPTWTGGFTGLDTDAGAQMVTQTDATASRRVAIAAAVHLNAGTAAVATAATWTNNATNRGTMMLTWQATVPGTITVVGAATLIALGRTTETDTMRGLTAVKAVALGRVTTTESMRPLALTKTIALGRITETTAMQALAATKTAPLARITETVSTRAIALSKSATLGRVTETDTAQPLGLSKTVALGRIATSEILRPLIVTKTVALGRVTATTTMRALALSGTGFRRQAAARHYSGAQRAAHYSGPQTATAYRG